MAKMRPTRKPFKFAVMINLEKELQQRLKKIKEHEYAHNAENLYNFNWKNAIRTLPLIVKYTKLPPRPSYQDPEKWDVFKDRYWYRIFTKLDRVILAKYHYNIIETSNSITTKDNFFSSSDLERDLKQRLNDLSTSFQKIFYLTKVFDPKRIESADELLKDLFEYSSQEHSHPPCFLTLKGIHQHLGKEKSDKCERAIYFDLGITNKSESFNIEDYGNIWYDFIKCLNDNESAYWAKFYERIFRQDFVLTEKDISEIKIRIMLSGLLCCDNRTSSYVASEMERYYNNDNITIEDFLISQYHNNQQLCEKCKKKRTGNTMSLEEFGKLYNIRMQAELNL